MGSFYYVMAILGCGDGEAACRELRVEPVRYRSAAQCQAAMAAVIQRSLGVPFPVVAAACRQQGHRIAQAETAPRG